MQNNFNFALVFRRLEGCGSPKQGSVARAAVAALEHIKNVYIRFPVNLSRMRVSFLRRRSKVYVM